MKKLFIIVVALSAFYATVAEDVPCETVDIFELNWAGIMSPKTCSFNSSVSVQSDGYQISNRFIPDPTVEGLRVANNRNLFYLPDNVFEKFRNLLWYDASHCSILEVSYKNFKHLEKATLVSLNGNKLSRIVDDTFSGLTSLATLGLGKKLLPLTRLMFYFVFEFILYFKLISFPNR